MRCKNPTPFSSQERASRAYVGQIPTPLHQGVRFVQVQLGLPRRRARLQPARRLPPRHQPLALPPRGQRLHGPRLLRLLLPARDARRPPVARRQDRQASAPPAAALRCRARRRRRSQEAGRQGEAGRPRRAGPAARDLGLPRHQQARSVPDPAVRLRLARQVHPGAAPPVRHEALRLVLEQGTSPASRTPTTTPTLPANAPPPSSPNTGRPRTS